MITYRVGDSIEYRTFGGALRQVQVTGRCEIKPGRPGFDGILERAEGPVSTGSLVWGYDRQVERVVTS